MEVHVDKQNLIDIANSLRTKKGEPSTKKYKVSEMAEGIDDIETGKFILPDKIQFTNSKSTDMNFLKNADTSQLTTMQGMFSSCDNITELDIANWNTSNVTNNMNNMFSGCSKLETVNVENWDVRNVTSMQSTFNFCTALVNIDCSKWELDNVIFLSSMFNSCTSLSNESLNSILKMCSTTKKMQYNKTLSQMGINATQAEICTSLSNYQAFLDAGWTTGY